MPNPETVIDKALQTYLGRPPTEAELTIYTLQRDRLETGIFNNALLPRDSVGNALVTLPFTP